MGNTLRPGDRGGDLEVAQNEEGRVSTNKVTFRVVLESIPPFCALYKMARIFWPDEKLKKAKYPSFHPIERAQEQKRSVILKIATGVGCVFLLLTLCLLASKTALLFGFRLWNWSMLATLFFLGYPYMYFLLEACTSMATRAFRPTEYKTLYYFGGLVNNMAAVLHGAIIFTIWMIHDQHHHPANNYIRCTLGTWLIATVLWTLKNAVLLWWTAKSIYTRFRDRFLLAAFRLYFLTCILACDGGVEALIPWKEDCSEFKRWLDDPAFPPLTNNREIYNIEGPKRDVQNYVLSRPVSIEQMIDLREHLMDLAKSTSEKDDLSSRDNILVTFRKNERVRYMTDRDIRGITKDECYYELFKAELKAEYPHKIIDRIPFDKWVVDTHKSCVGVGYTLVDAFEMVVVLDTILTWCLLPVVIIVWLLVTQLATTKVLVLIASQILALAFVFGETCKTFFRGFIFAFVSHPFYIGDRCIINKEEVEVKRINVLTTTCSKIGTNERMLYPNSILANTLLINHGDKVGPSDVINLTFVESSAPKLRKLKKKIDRYLSSREQRRYFEKSYEIVIDERKMSIHFVHTVGGRDVSHSKFNRKKGSGRSRLYLKIMRFASDLDIQVFTLGGGATGREEGAPATAEPQGGMGEAPATAEPQGETGGSS